MAVFSNLLIEFDTLPLPVVLALVVVIYEKKKAVPSIDTDGAGITKTLVPYSGST